jgi:hypothetical protein
MLASGDRPAAAGLLNAPRSGLPPWCDALLQGAATGDFFSSRLWFDTTLSHAVRAADQPILAVCGPDAAMLLPMLRGEAGRLTSLTTPYSLAWQPLVASGTDAQALRRAGSDLAALLRRGPPVLLEAIDPALPPLPPLLAGLRRSGLAVLRFDHFGNRYEKLPAGTGWNDYLAGRSSALRNTIRRKLALCEREMRFEAAARPGAELEADIAAYHAVRAGSWKPEEPFPGFDAALMRAAAAEGVLRLGVLRLHDGTPVAAQYWILDRGGARATVLKLSHVEAHRAASPGTALTAMMIRRLLEQDRVEELDFGRGDDPYKQLWVGARRQRIGLILADPLHPAGLAAIARQAAGGLRRWLRGPRPPAGTAEAEARS